MKTIYLTGQRTFSNRGCEAIVRSTVHAIRRIAPETRFLVPSDDILRDSAQWPDAANHGVVLVQAYKAPYTRPWVHAQRLPLPWLKRLGWPFPFPRWLREQMASVDGVLSVGGDNYSLDYRLPSPLMGLDGLALRLGKPTVLWGASVGPFEKEQMFIPAICKHLARFDLVGVRESVSYDYLTSELQLDNVMQMVDSAFILEKVPVTTEAFWPTGAPNGVLGLNVSPLVERYKQVGQELRSEVIGFIRTAIEEYGFNVLLVPHVIPLDGAEKNNDARYMTPILEATADLGRSVSMTPVDLNAAQIKDVIAKLRFFIGARTHATIAALSTGVPTISIAYSVKARGINRDLFGHEEVVLPTPLVSTTTLEERLQYLIDNESTLKIALAKRKSEYKQNIDSAATRVVEFIHG
ncbi:polysaccharide pyruvyl transferase family protein [Desulfobulbus alkaliphilus]|uniref:polysaccharide pyruvyl transferase family protein n=1 Tax=Desulfobulbus alkaliphilus TaxID=869814 RepID=UPI0019656EDC|nr:polysaccharide pyruvyl transferase family protein [Desulfobulbus alkaliphilus]MBM9538608.1 polysaccharide pyruvyl transferase family protein [Desulfobulbus alkaliphilus]